MKTRLFYAILVAVGICLQGCTTSYAKDREDAKETPAGERLEISFRFQRGGIASSQYAIWIEDETGSWYVPCMLRLLQQKEDMNTGKMPFLSGRARQNLKPCLPHKSMP